MSCISCWNQTCILRGSFSIEGDNGCKNYISEDQCEGSIGVSPYKKEKFK